MKKKGSKKAIGKDYYFETRCQVATKNYSDFAERIINSSTKLYYSWRAIKKKKYGKAGFNRDDAGVVDWLWWWVYTE